MKAFLSSLALGAALISAPAGAVTISVNQSGNNSGGSSFWTDSLTFNLPANAINTVLNISYAGADDRMVIQLNGSDILSVGIFGYAVNGNFHYTASDANNAHAFEDNGFRNQNVTSGFQTGTNTLLFIINDTGSGIFGDFTNGADGPAGPTGYDFTGTVTYDLSNAVPEPATWALLIMGFGAVGASMRRRTQLAYA